MNRRIAIGLGVSALSLLIGTREWLVQREISEVQSQIRLQVRDQIQSAEDLDRLQELQGSSHAYSYYMEPVILNAQRLIWPFSRDSIVTEWKRELFQSLSDQSYSKKLKLQTQVDDEIKALQQQKDPSMARLLETLNLKSKNVSPKELADWIEGEVQSLSQFAREQDRKTLDSIKAEGIQILRTFKARLLKMDQKGLANYLARGDFSRDVQSPILNLTFKLKQEEARTHTWAEYQKSLNTILQERKAHLIKNSRTSQKEKLSSEADKIQKMFDSVAKAVDNEVAPAAPSPSLVAPKAAPESPQALDYQE